MEIIGGKSRWELVIRRESQHIVLLRAATPDEKAVLPDELFGLPVTVLGDHALTPGAAPVPGEVVRITRGSDWGKADSRSLRDLKLPCGLQTVGDYAFYNCSALQTLRLHDEIRQWGGGALMNCAALNRFFLTRTADRQGPSLAFFADELQGELDVSITRQSGERLRLIFPDFVESYEENGPAHHFDYKIYGAGHPYHHLFRQRQLLLRDYDGLWATYLREEYDPGAALRLAWYRLRYPVELSREAEAQYWDYLATCTPEAMLFLLDERDTEGLGLLLERLHPGEELLRQAAEQARTAAYPEAMALLLQKQQSEKPRGFAKTFDI